MQYDPIKKSVGALFNRSIFLRRLFYTLLDILLLRSWHVRRKLKSVSASLPGDAAVMDAGAGFGQYTWRMARKNPRWTIDAVDIDDDHVAQASGFFSKTPVASRVTFTKGDLTTFSDKEKYDLILSVDVMEHILDDVTVMKNFCNALKKNGCLVISTPSDKGGSDAHDHDDDSFIGEHVRNGYGITEIEEKLTMAGFSDTECRYTYGKPGSLSWVISMKIPVLMAGKWKPLLIFLPFYYLIVMPFALLLNLADTMITHKEGTGLIVTAYKRTD